MKNNNTLDLSLTYKWFDLIASGDKKEEYRELKDFYKKRLTNLDGSFKNYNYVKFHRGQGSPVTMTVEYRGVSIGYGNPDWGAPEDREVYIIRLGEIIENNHKTQ